MAITGTTTGRRFGMVALLALAMAAGTFILPAIGVLASSIRQDLGLELWQVGLLVTGSPMVGALLAPPLGRVTDRVGGKASMVATLGVGALTLALFAASPTFLILVGATLLTGVSQGWANPATNKVISRHYPPGGRGVVIGIKQSGVQFGSFLAGLALPAAALALGWRGALLVASTIPLLGTVLAAAFVPADPPSPSVPNRGQRPPLPGEVRFLAVYGFLLGLTVSATIAYTALFAEDVLGLAPATAGVVVALAGLVGILGRVVWGGVADARGRHTGILGLLGVVGATAGLLMVGAATISPLLIWPAAVATGAGINAWNAVGMLAVVSVVPEEAAGHASGVVQFGFLMGLALGAPIFGAVVDATGSYLPGWLGVAVICLVASLLTVMRRSAAERVG
ncbi:MAG TPA: MFS transporter [Acidimicrobiia bacterium]|nr:MFS transporter [Acidimicrobiia bacterium]